MKLAVLILVLAVVPCFAAESLDKSGNAFVREWSVVDKPAEQISESDLYDISHCYGYILGISDGMTIVGVWSNNPEIFCRPSPGIEVQQQLRILLKYIHDNPAEAHLPTALLYLKAMKGAFPCSNQNT